MKSRQGRFDVAQRPMGSSQIGTTNHRRPYSLAGSGIKPFLMRRASVMALCIVGSMDSRVSVYDGLSDESGGVQAAETGTRVLEALTGLGPAPMLKAIAERATSDSQTCGARPPGLPVGT
jgi:hypothetical protein